MANIVRLIITDFLKLFGLAVIIAGPLFYFLDQILVQDIFAYSAETGVAFYFFAGLLVLITGLLAVLLQTIKAARANPIEALRYE
jgi:putative ABC transport system permease protein